ncbi:MAG TPA: hypothetical protein PK095_25790, partial [Myxococcota bacterium]|nr:hypothetical protein [Myxococcota bacterium]
PKPLAGRTILQIIPDLNAGGAERTTIDIALQQAAEAALVSVIRQHGVNQGARTGALVSMEPDGAVRALVGGLDYGESQFNRATHARRQPGSSFKLYVYAAAL